MSLPRLHDLDPEYDQDLRYLPSSIERELQDRLPREAEDWTTPKRPRSQDSDLAAIVAAVTSAALAIVVIALVVAYSIDRARGVARATAEQPLLLGNGGRNIVDCVSDRLQLFVPRSEQPEEESPEVELKAGRKALTLIPEKVEGGYYAALDVERGEVGLEDGLDLRVRPGDDVVVRVGEHDPTVVAVHGRHSAGNDGEEVCDPILRHQLLP